MSVILWEPSNTSVNGYAPCRSGPGLFKGCSVYLPPSFVKYGGELFLSFSPSLPLSLCCLATDGTENKTKKNLRRVVIFKRFFGRFPVGYCLGTTTIGKRKVDSISGPLSIERLLIFLVDIGPATVVLFGYVHESHYI